MNADLVPLSRDQHNEIAPWFGRVKDASVLVDRDWTLVRSCASELRTKLILLFSKGSFRYCKKYFAPPNSPRHIFG
jgi:hypothetical protein